MIITTGKQDIKYSRILLSEAHEGNRNLFKKAGVQDSQ